MTPRFRFLFLSAITIPTVATAHGRHGGLVKAPPRATASDAAATAGRSWLAGDHHIHSRFSAGYEVDPADPAAPPVPQLGKDGRYPIPTNAERARFHGLRWISTTDHGGPLHAKLNYEQTYPELLRSRAAVPEVLQFYGMEFDTPAGDHSSLIVPHTSAERDQLLDIESRFSKREAWPLDPARDVEPRMIEALRHMRAQSSPPVVIANHPSRSAPAIGVYGQYTPSEFRNWNDIAPNVAIGMEGAPGHQATSLKPDGTSKADGVRGYYGNAPTIGGFDQMTARLGRFWDSMLGEGRRWWITSTSDSHVNWRDGGGDFWAGEYSKTYVHARPDHADILAGLRDGRVFVTTGDLVSELDVTARAAGAPSHAAIGGTLTVRTGRDVEVKIHLRDPAGANATGYSSDVRRVDLIVGDITGPATDRTVDRNPSTRAVKRFAAGGWKRDGEYLTMTHRLRRVRTPLYLRVRGTSTSELEPTPDPRGEDPWSDLWFYSNPIFVITAK
ncbi:phosphoesterase [uncultured Sphingomonas sp.]|uniref:phosphoesterase n=1 Tax=uncultured Sphingomonas sp. TaxID=158754 RepID=UPI0035CB741D